jgi:hypothetical protein
MRPWAVLARRCSSCSGLIWVALARCCSRSSARVRAERPRRRALVRARAEAGTIDYTRATRRQLEKMVRYPEVARSFSVVSLGMGGPES